ncbi:hypothetical protein HanIR_Chr17g0898811 [Helianthus annuus]|nr:hypothetical protein HanIR_Chr17g0898811 [Helianthus annuus]
MSFSGRKRRSTMYSILLLLIIFSLLQIWVFSTDCCRVRAIRIPSSSSTSTSLSTSKDSDKIKRLELYRKYFNGRSKQKMNTTTGSKGKGFQENNRKVPSCPDALHN